MISSNVNTYLPKVDLKISRNYEAFVPEGMICSLAELGLAKNQLGFIFLSKQYP